MSAPVSKKVKEAFLVFLANNCAVVEHAADGRLVGRCAFHLAQFNHPIQGDRVFCPRHGDVTLVRKRFIDEGRLTDDRILERRNRLVDIRINRG